MNEERPIEGHVQPLVAAHANGGNESPVGMAARPLPPRRCPVCACEMTARGIVYVYCTGCGYGAPESERESVRVGGNVKTQLSAPAADGSNPKRNATAGGD